MWTTEHNVETDAEPEVIWGMWSDVSRWPEWNADLERTEISGPFAAGSRCFPMRESRSSCGSRRP